LALLLLLSREPQVNQREGGPLYIYAV